MGTTIFGILCGVFLIAAGLADIHDENLASLIFLVFFFLILVGAVFLLGIAKFIGRKKK